MPDFACFALRILLILPWCKLVRQTQNIFQHGLLGIQFSSQPVTFSKPLASRLDDMVPVIQVLFLLDFSDVICRCLSSMLQFG